MLNASKAVDRKMLAMGFKVQLSHFESINRTAAEAQNEYGLIPFGSSISLMKLPHQVCESEYGREW
jgi:hypothetical protein